MNISDSGVNFICSFEDFSPTPFSSTNDQKNVSIGYGTMEYPDGSKVTRKDAPITEDQGKQLIKAFVAKNISRWLNGYLPRLQQNQFDALCSFIYNVGLGNFQTSSLYKAIKSDAQPKDIRVAFTNWKMAGGRVNETLLRRRHAEADMFLGEVGNAYDISHIEEINFDDQVLEQPDTPRPKLSKRPERKQSPQPPPAQPETPKDQPKNQSTQPTTPEPEPEYVTLLPTISKIANLSGDTIEGADHLDIGKDITAFAKIIAAEQFEPPLAIALFGKWGSGKSFFMHNLQARIKSLSDHDNSGLYCKGIVPIHFNAWSYLDANLWASIVARIFEGLNDYISKNLKENQFKETIAKELAGKLSIANEEVKVLEKQHTEIGNKIQTLTDEKDKLEKTLENKIREIGEDKLTAAIEAINDQYSIDKKITEAIGNNQSIKNAKQQLAQIIPEKYFNDPAEAYKQASSTQTFIKEFFNQKNIKWNIACIAILIIIIFVLPGAIAGVSDMLNSVNLVLPEVVLSLLAVIVPVWKKIEATYKKLQPFIASLWKIRNDHKKAIEAAVFAHDQREKAIRLEIEYKNTEIIAINKQIQEATSTINDLNFRIKNAMATEALYSFIEKRCKSDDYKKHLGIVSIIRDDFDTLSKLFLGHKAELNANEADKKISEEFRKKFEKPLERIILYVDDLDRCNEDRVVEVLEAVNLLMAFPLFVVIVGVDSRWIKNALIKRYQMQFTGRINGEQMNEYIEQIDASNYLEKIFQVPFHLKEASDNQIKKMLLNLTNTKKKHNSVINSSNAKNDGNGKRKMNEKLADPGAIADVNIDIGMDGISTVEIANNTEAIAEREYLEISDTEIFSMQDMSEILGTNPRAIKRFINIYRIVRAHEELAYSPKDSDKELQAIMFMLAMSIGRFKQLNPYLEKFILVPENEKKKLAAFFNADLKLNDVFAQYNNSNFENKEFQHKKEVDLSELSYVAELNKSKRQLTNILISKDFYKVVLAIPLSSYKGYYTFIRRFTFEDNF